MMRLVFVLLGVLFSSPVSAALITISAGTNNTAIQAAIDGASPGDTICFQASSTFSGPITLGNLTNGTAGNPITVTTCGTPAPAAGYQTNPTYAATYAVILNSAAPGQSILVKDSAHDWVIQTISAQPLNGNAGAHEGITLIYIGNVTTPSTFLTSNFIPNQQPRTITLDRVYVHGTPGGQQVRGIIDYGFGTRVINSWVDEISNSSLDTQALYCPYCQWAFYHNNHLEATGENLFFGASDVDPAWPQFTVHHGAAVRNTITKPLKWNPMNAVWQNTRSVGVISGITTGVTPTVTISSGTTGTGGLMYISGVSGMPAINNKAWNVNRVDSTHFTLSGADTTGQTYGGGGNVYETYNVKNLVELKTGVDMVFDSNDISQTWSSGDGGQDGTAVLFTPFQDQCGAPGNAWPIASVTNTNGVAVSITVTDVGNTLKWCTTNNVTISGVSGTLGTLINGARVLTAPSTTSNTFTINVTGDGTSTGSGGTATNFANRSQAFQTARIDFTNNKVLNAAKAFNIKGIDVYAYPAGARNLTNTIRLINNVTNNINLGASSYTQNCGQPGSCAGGGSGFLFFSTAIGIDQLTVLHHTDYASVSDGSILDLNGDPTVMSNLTMKHSIFRSRNYGIHGYSPAGVGNTPLDAMTGTNAFTSNVIVNGDDNGNSCGFYTHWTGNYFQTSAVDCPGSAYLTYTDLNMKSTATGEFSLTSSSAYKKGGARQATDSCQMGASWYRQDAGRGLVPDPTRPTEC